MGLVLLLGATAFAQPSPAPITLDGHTGTNGHFALSFPSDTNFWYSLEYRETLGQDSVWTAVDDFADQQGTGHTLSYVDTNGLHQLAKRYYRLRIANGESVEESTDVLALYEFNQEVETAQVVHPDVSAGTVEVSSSSLNFGTAQSETWIESGVEYAQGNSGWGVTNPLSAKHFAYTLIPAGTELITITNVRFWARATGSGPSAIALIINEDVIFQQDMPADNTIVLAIPVPDQTGLTQAVVRIAGWDNGSRTTSGGGHFRIDDVRTTGFTAPPPDPEPPTVTAPQYTNVTDTSAVLGAEIADTGRRTVTERGIYWDTNEQFVPPQEGTRVAESGAFAAGLYTLSVTNLPTDATIYFHGFATNEIGLALSEQASFTTAALPVLFPPVVTNPAAGTITETSAQLGGTVTDDGGGILVERGIYWSTDPAFIPPETGQRLFEVGEFETGVFMLNVNELPSGTTIYYSAYAANAQTNGYSDTASFSTLDADDLAFFTFSGNQPTPESHRESIVPTTLTLSAGSFSYGWVTSHASDWGNEGATEPYADAGGTGYWSAGDQDTARYFEFNLAAESGWLMTVTGITYVARATAAGPSVTGVSLNGNNIHEQNLDADDTLTVQIAVTNAMDLNSAQIRIQGWTNGWRATSGNGSFRVDNIRVTGSMAMNIETADPVVTTPAATSITAAEADAGGTVTDDGGSVLIERGVYWSTTSGFTFPDGAMRIAETGTFENEPFLVPLYSLPPDTTIYFRAFASTAAGTGYTEESSFITAPSAGTLLARYAFSGQVVTPIVRHPTVTSSHFVQDAGAPGLATQNESSWTGSGVPYAQLVGELSHPTPEGARHFVYSLEAVWGTTFAITNISLRARSTSDGPSAISVSIDQDVLYTENLAAGDVVTLSVPVAALTNRTFATIRIHGWDNGSRTTGGAGLFQVDDILTHGTTSGVPETPDPTGRRVRVASLNVKTGIGAPGEADYEALKAVLQRIDADIIAFQELFSTQTNDWQALATELGYSDTAISSEWDLSGSQRLGYFSRFPIQSVTHVLSPPPAKEITRAIFRTVVAVPDAEQPLILWNMHKKAIGGEINQFSRAIETIRLLQDVNAYQQANPAHTELVVLGDANADAWVEDQATSFDLAWYTANQDQFSATYELGNDIVWPVAYHRFPDERYTENAVPLHRPILTQADGNSLYSFGDGSFISRLDYIFLSDALADKTPAGEIYNAAFDGPYPGLPKAGAALAADTTSTSSDHFPLVMDLYMTAAVPSATATSIMQEDTRISSVASTDASGPEKTPDQSAASLTAPVEEADTDASTNTETLEALANRTRLEIVTRPDGQAELRFNTERGVTYTLEYLDTDHLAAGWTVLHAVEQVPGNGDVRSEIDAGPGPRGGSRLYRLRMEDTP